MGLSYPSYHVDSRGLSSVAERGSSQTGKRPWGQESLILFETWSDNVKLSLFLRWNCGLDGDI